MLLLDRYLVANGRAVDLATGAAVRRRHRPPSSPQPPPLFTVRNQSWLIDVDLRRSSRIEVWERAGVRPAERSEDAVRSFRSLLADARDGHPRALDLVESSSHQWSWLHRVLAREARLAGFVPVAADALGAVLAQSHWRWPSWLRERRLVVFATDSRLSPDASLAMFRLATKDARPHLVVRCATSELWRPRLATSAFHLHEGAPGDQNVDSTTALVNRAEVLRDAGRVVEAEAAARWSLLLADEDSLAERPRSDARAARVEPIIIEEFIEVLRVCQEHDEPDRALALVAARLRASLAASAVAVILPGHTTPVAAACVGNAALSPGEWLGALHVCDTGQPSTLPAPGASGDVAWPVRYGATVVGALWGRWAAGRTLTPRDVSALLDLVAAAIGPAVHQIREHTRAQPPRVLVPELIGDSAGMTKVREAVLRAATSPFPVLIEGESGAGKELVARAVHAASARRGRRFCALNCAALADDLVETELFGHTRGAFTGAVTDRVGLFEEAQGGTLFLDEVAELSARVQAKLLRTLQEGEVRRLGESLTRKVDARIVAATNRPLQGEVEAGRFRNDLRYRIDVLRIAIPPLRARLEDLPSLIRHVWSELAKRTGSRAVLSPSTMAALGGYDWPGNVRELQNVLASIMVAGPSRGVIGPHGLPGHLGRTITVARRVTLADARRDFEQRYVRAALLRSGGKAGAAARELGVSRQGLRKLITRLALSDPGAATGAH